MSWFDEFQDFGDQDEVEDLRQKVRDLEQEKAQRQLDAEMRYHNGSDDTHIGPP